MNFKKFFLIFFLTGIFLFNFISAIDEQGISAAAQSLENKAENITKLLDNPSATKEDLSAQYLRREWFGPTGMLAKNPFLGVLYGFYLDKQTYIDPVFLFIFGLEPAFSWLFFLNLIIVLCLMTYFYRFYEALRDFSTFSNSSAKWISFCFFIILMVIGFFRILATIFSNLIINLISNLDSVPMQIIGVLICIFFFVFIIKFSKKIKIYMHIKDKENKEMHKEMRGELAIEKLETYGKALDEGFKDKEEI